jgi:adenylylsulfate kinase
MIYWLTGQPGHGKTVLGGLLTDTLELFEKKKVVHIDGDDIREILDNKDYSREGRMKNITTIQNISQILNNKGFDVVVSVVAPYRDIREDFKLKMKGDLVEIYVHTSESRQRDHYHVEDYEQPIFDYIDCDTTGVEPTQSLDYILEQIKKKN